MKYTDETPLVTTITERCRVCYTCVRECPAKAIRISNGQAEVIAERCIGCGNCVRVCSQNAKRVLDTTNHVRTLLAEADCVAACLAPSFPAEFVDMDHEHLVGMIRALGFGKVCEVGFGADMVAAEYSRWMANDNRHGCIATTCPAIVTYVEKYCPDIVPRLAPIVSPMIASARALRSIYGSDLKIVFIGPCIAKKGEATHHDVPDDIDGAITFAELWQMFDEAGLKNESVEPSDFDPPRAGTGGLFSISRGLLQAADIHEDLVTSNVVAAEGTNFIEAIKEFRSGDLEVDLLEVLCCEGCIMGAGMTTEDPLFRRRARVADYVRSRMQDARPAPLPNVNMRRTFTANDQRLDTPFEDELKLILSRMGKFAPEDELNCGACGYATCREHAVAIFKGMAESEMCLPYTIDQLRRTIDELGLSNRQLADTQEALLQAEKLANMGQLAAGIAHEVNNPLGVVLMYAHLLMDETKKTDPTRADLEMIVEQADRCKKIVAGLLHFARQNKVVLQLTNARELINRSIIAISVPDDVKICILDQLEDQTVEVDPDQIVQVLTNLFSNSLAAMEDKGKLTIELSGDDKAVQFAVSDTGCGIVKTNLGKIFDPFFTTKQIGKGTGLGLAVTYGIVKMHRGDITVVSNADTQSGPTGTTFTVTIPRRGRDS